MAHKKKARKAPKRHHRRRIGAVHHGGDMMHDGMELVGIVVGSVLATSIQRHATSMNPKLISAAEIVGGMFLKHRATSPIVQGIGYGIAGAGAIGIASEFNVIHGVDSLCTRLFPGSGHHGHHGHHHHGMHNGMHVMPVHVPMAQTSPGPIPNTSAPMPAATAPAVGYYNMADVSGLSNYNMMSGIRNNEMMSGGEGMSLHDEYESVRSLG